MNHRKMLYGYQIRNGEIAVVEEEAILVRRAFSLYTGGLSYSDQSRQNPRITIVIRGFCLLLTKMSKIRLIIGYDYISIETASRFDRDGRSCNLFY